MYPELDLIWTTDLGPETSPGYFPEEWSLPEFALTEEVLEDMSYLWEAAMDEQDILANGMLMWLGYFAYLAMEANYHPYLLTEKLGIDRKRFETVDRNILAKMVYDLRYSRKREDKEKATQAAMALMLKGL